MIAQLIWKLTTFKKIQKFNIDHTSETGAITEYAAEKTKLNDAVLNIEADEIIINQNTKGITDDTNADKVNMADTVYQYAHKALPKARDAKKETFVKQLEIEVYQILKASKADALTIARGIRKLLADNPTLFDNIEPAELTDLDDTIAKYDASQANPAMAIETKKITATELIIKEYENADAAIENMVDYFVGKYFKTKRALVKEMKNCLRIEVEGVHHTGLIVSCKQANPPAGAFPYEEGVLCKIVERNREVLTDINGMGSIIKFMPGTMHVEFSKAGFVTKTMIIIFKRGHIEEVEVVMEKVVNP